MDDKLKKHGAISWSELMTTDVSAAKSFYGKMFGWQFEEMPMETEEMAYTVVKANDDEVAGIMPFPKDVHADMPPVWGLYITVDNVDEAVEKATVLGAKIHMPPKDIPEVGRFCVLQDPQGAFISLITYSDES
jgi:predicted enzyme related to lactoylglutathione lyase